MSIVKIISMIAGGYDDSVVVVDPDPGGPAPITQGLAIGDSTVVTYVGGTAVNELLLTGGEITAGYTCASIAAAGHTIQQQLTAWNAYGSKSELEWIIVQVGLNNCQFNIDFPTTLAAYQELIDQINTDKPVGCKVILSTMIPCRQRWYDMDGYVSGEISYQNWINLNEAIRGNGADAITGADYVVDQHTVDMADVDNNLDAAYDTGDAIHPNTAGRQINADSWRAGLIQLNMLDPV